VFNYFMFIYLKNIPSLDVGKKASQGRFDFPGFCLPITNSQLPTANSLLAVKTLALYKVTNIFD